MVRYAMTIEFLLEYAALSPFSTCDVHVRVEYILLLCLTLRMCVCPPKEASWAFELLRGSRYAHPCFS